MPSRRSSWKEVARRIYFAGPSGFATGRRSSKEKSETAGCLAFHFKDMAVPDDGTSSSSPNFFEQNFSPSGGRNVLVTAW